MRRIKDLKRYGKHFIENLSMHLKDRLKISIEIYPVDSDGALIEFKINDSSNKVTVHPVQSSIASVLKDIDQSFIQADPKTIKFGGTNIFMNDRRVLLIKGEDDQDIWSNRAALDDVKKIISPKGEKG